MSYFIPPVNYGMVEEDLYRSGQPNELNFPFLERLNLRTIVYLALEEPNPQFQSFVEEQEIRLLFLGGNTRMESRRKAWEPLSEETVLAALAVILDRANYPLLITCHLGRDRTGACVRALPFLPFRQVCEVMRTNRTTDWSVDLLLRGDGRGCGRVPAQDPAVAPVVHLRGVPAVRGQQGAAAERAVHRAVRHGPGDHPGQPAVLAAQALALTWNTRVANTNQHIVNHWEPDAFASFVDPNAGLVATFRASLPLPRTIRPTGDARSQRGGRE
jgi:hypothetical protein